MPNYWTKRNQRLQEALAKQSNKDIMARLSKYYSTAAKTVVAEFERTYLRVLNAVEEGRAPTPADLYKLDTYWKM